MATVIITVPHAICRDQNDIIRHKCDVVAERVARGLFDRLTDRGHRVLLRIADIPREKVDLNRPEGRYTSYRKDLARDFPRADFLIDVHSFPLRRGFWREDIILLKWANEGLDNREHVWSLLDRLARLDLNVAVVYAEKSNDIVAHALEKGLPAILVEFSEVSIAEDERRVMGAFSEALDGLIQTLSKRIGEAKIFKLLDQLS